MTIVTRPPGVSSMVDCGPPSILASSRLRGCISSEQQLMLDELLIEAGEGFHTAAVHIIMNIRIFFVSFGSL